MPAFQPEMGLRPYVHNEFFMKLGFGIDWNREHDNIGVGYTYLSGGNLEINASQVFEAYYRFGFTEEIGISADVQ